jgi:hypothetical protein
LLLAACARSQPSVDGATPVQSVGNTTIAKPERPRPYPVEETAGFRKAVEKGTRTRTGQPGPNYWQQWARYRLTADYDPATGLVQGTAEVRYFNRSPTRSGAAGAHLRQHVRPGRDAHPQGAGAAARDHLPRRRARRELGATPTPGRAATG